MKKLIMPEINNLELWENIVSKKHLVTRKRLQSIKSSIKDRYLTYTANARNLSNVKPSLDTAITGNKDDLISCYGDNVNFVPIKKKLFELSHKCPYCCINRPNTLDHYFDKKDYPEFSVFVPNLIPCCSECNGTKSTYIFDNDGERIFLHYYYDEIPNYQFIFIRFEIGSDGIPVFKAYLKFEKQTYLTNIIERHFNKLCLLNKYEDCVKERLSTLLLEINRYKNIVPDIIKEILLIQFNSLFESKGANYWETCLYEGLLNSQDFLERYLA